jgi:cyclohexadienyl dehydratase
MLDPGAAAKVRARKRDPMRKPLRSVRLLAHPVLIIALAISSSQARPLRSILSDHTLKVGMTGDYPPFSLRSAEGQMSGADVTMAKELAKALGVELEIVPTTWRTIQADLQADRYDVVMGGVTVTPVRAAVGDFSLPVLHDGKRPIVRCPDRYRYVSIPSIDRPEVRVIFNPGGTNERFAKTHLRHAILEDHSDNRTIFDALAAGRADVMITDGAEVDYQAHIHAGVLCPGAVSDSFDHSEKAFWMTRDPALRAAVDAWLTPVVQSGRYEKALADAASRSTEIPKPSTQ